MQRAAKQRGTDAESPRDLTIAALRVEALVVARDVEPLADPFFASVLEVALRGAGFAVSVYSSQLEVSRTLCLAAGECREETCARGLVVG